MTDEEREQAELELHQARNELYLLLTNPPDTTALDAWRADLRQRRREVERLEDSVLAPADEGVFGGKWFCRCGHAFRPYHLTPGTECARRGCECGRFAPADEAQHD